MKVDEIKQTVIFQALRKNKEVQRAALRLQKSEDWVTLKLFVNEVKQVLMEAVFEEDKPAENARYRYLVRGMEGLILLPELVGLIVKLEKDEKKREETKDRDAQRRKYAPGNFIRSTVKKIKGGD
jgi:hypothetical protein